MKLDLGIRAKLFLVSLGLIAVSMTAADLLLTTQLDAEMSDRAEAELYVRLALVERDVSAHAAPLDALDPWDALADDLGRRAEARVTVVRADGLVLGDSEVALDALPGVGSHADRPEVVAALGAGRGTSVRHSATLGERMLYVARPFAHASAAAHAGVVRLARPLTQVDEAIAHTHRLVAVASGIALLLAVLMTSLAAQWLGGAVRAVTRVARRMAGGELGARTRATGRDEVATLGRALDELATNLGTTLAELRSERDVLGGVLESMREGVMVLGPDGRVALANRALCEMVGVAPGEAPGKTPLELARSTARGRARGEGARNGEATTEIELAPRRLLVHFAALAGRPGARLGVFVDVTELRRLEHVRKDFVANVSHELRTPVSAVLSATETLRAAGLGSPEAPEFLSILERHAERLANLVQDLLDLSRIEARSFQPRLAPVPLAPVVAAVLGAFRDAAAHKGLALESELAPEPLAVRADARAVEQVLSNLVDNAVKYATAGPIVVRALSLADAVRIEVEDCGPGIERRHLARLFERFYRIDTGRSRELGGTGLGLAIVKHLVESMGGRVDVESEPGLGTTFGVTLPRA
ncbi:MAG: PAS domain-containing protein [Myxococcales bacterium]|nr:PAS domain-containing protein [Myxococcales bacterium]